MKNPIIKLSSAILLIFLSLLFGRCPAAAAQNNSLNASRTLLDIGVVLDLGTPLGKMSNVSISMALDDFYTTHNSYTTGLNLLWRDSNEDDVDAASMGTLVMPSHSLSHSFEVMHVVLVVIAIHLQGELCCPWPIHDM